MDDMKIEISRSLRIDGYTYSFDVDSTDSHKPSESGIKIVAERLKSSCGVHLYHVEFVG
jgi:hypothetical protein